MIKLLGAGHNAFVILRTNSPVPVWLRTIITTFILQCVVELLNVEAMPWEEKTGIMELVVQVDVQVCEICEVETVSYASSNQPDDLPSHNELVWLIGGTILVTPLVLVSGL